MMTRTTLALLGVGALWSAGHASAAVMYDTALASPPGMYGTQNANEHFVVNTTNGVELGLATVIRYENTVAPTPGTSNYYVMAGNSTNANATQGSSLWGFVFSVNAAASGLTLSNLMINLTVTDTATGSVVSFDPVTLFSDNTYYNPNRSPTVHGGGPRVIVPDRSGRETGDVGFQNAATLSYGRNQGSYFDPTYSSSRTDQYVFTLSATGLDGTSYGSVTESVFVPEPMSMAVLGIGLVGLAAMRRRGV